MVIIIRRIWPIVGVHVVMQWIYSNRTKLLLIFVVLRLWATQHMNSLESVLVCFTSTGPCLLAHFGVIMLC